MLLKIEDLRYQIGEFALRIDELKIDRGERVLILGASGSGKSTFLNLITGIISPDQGRIVVDQVDLAALGGGKQDRQRGETFGIVFQTLNLLPFASAVDNVMSGVAFAPKRRAGVQGADAQDLLIKLGLTERAFNQKVSNLSIGQQQRVSIARALIGSPPLVVADEPTSALDEVNRDLFLNLLFESLDTSKQALLMVSHDTSLESRFDRIIRIEDFVL